MSILLSSRKNKAAASAANDNCDIMLLDYTSTTKTNTKSAAITSTSTSPETSTHQLFRNNACTNISSRGISNKIIIFGGLILFCYSGIISIHQHHRILSGSSSNGSNGSSSSSSWKEAPGIVPYEQHQQQQQQQQQQQLLQQNVLKVITTTITTAAAAAAQSSTSNRDDDDDNNKKRIATSTTPTPTTPPTTAIAATATAIAATSTTPLQQWEALIAQNKNITTRSVLDVPLESYYNNNHSNLYNQNVSNSNSNSSISSSSNNTLLKVYIYDTNSFPNEYIHDVLDWLQLKRYDSNWITDYILIKLFQSYPGRTYNASDADIFVVPYPHAGHCIKTPGYTLKCKQLNTTKIQEDIFDNLIYYNTETANKHLFLLSDYDILVQQWLIKQPLLLMYGPRFDHPSGKKKPKKYRSPKGHIIIPPFNSALRFQPSYNNNNNNQNNNNQNVETTNFLKGEQQQATIQPQEQEQQNYNGRVVVRNTTNTTITATETATTATKTKRDLSLVFIANDKNKNMKVSPRLFRTFLLKELDKMKQYGNDTALIGGLPFISSDKVDDTYNIIESLSTSTNGTDSTDNSNSTLSIYDLYSRSIFCPILPGDISWQRRFFDVIGCGCIPVVLSYPILQGLNSNKNSKRSKNSRPNSRPTRSWYVPENDIYGIDDTWSVEESYPFINGGNSINYRNFVIEVSGNETHPEQSIQHLIFTLNKLLIEHKNVNENNEISTTTKKKSIIQQKQDALQNEVGNSFLYGIGPDAHVHQDDAFGNLLLSLKYYLNNDI